MCLTVPYNLAIHFADEDTDNQLFLSLGIDICFLIDILATFNTAIPISQTMMI